MPPFIHPWSVVDVLKHHAVSSTHEQLDGILTAFIRDEFGKRKVAPACVFPLPGPQPPNHRTISPTRHLVLCLKIPRSYGLHAAQLEAELLRVAGHRACRRAIGTLRPQIKEIILRRHEKPLARRKPLAKHEPLANKPLAKPPAKPPATKELPWKCARRHCIEADDVLELGGGIVDRVVGSGGVG